MFRCCTGNGSEHVMSPVNDLSVTTSGRLTSQFVKKTRQRKIKPCDSYTSLPMVYKNNDQRLIDINPRLASVASLFPLYRTTRKDALIEANEELEFIEQKTLMYPDNQALSFSPTAVVHLIPRAFRCNWRNIFCCTKPAPEPEWPDRFLKKVDEKLHDIHDVSVITGLESDWTSPLQIPTKPCISLKPRSHFKPKAKLNPFLGLDFYWQIHYRQKILHYFEIMSKVDLNKEKFNFSSQTVSKSIVYWPDPTIKRKINNQQILKAHKNLTEKSLYGVPDGYKSSALKLSYRHRDRHYPVKVTRKINKRKLYNRSIASNSSVSLQKNTVASSSETLVFEAKRSQSLLHVHSDMLADELHREYLICETPDMDVTGTQNIPESESLHKPLPIASDSSIIKNVQNMSKSTETNIKWSMGSLHSASCYVRNSQDKIQDATETHIM